MNDRLGDLGADTPSWAVDSSSNDIETGNNNNNNWSSHNTANKRDSNPFVDLSGNTPPKQKPNKKQDWHDLHDNTDSFQDFTNTSENQKQIESQTYMDAFFRDVQSIQSSIQEINHATKRIGEINEETILTTSEAKEKSLSMELRPLIDQTNKKAKKTKNLLQVLKEETGKLNKEKKLTTADLRVRDNLCNTTTRKFIDEMKLYQNAQQKYKSDLKSKNERQIRNVNPSATDEEIDQIMRSDGGREQLFQQQILAGGVNDQIKQTYTKVSTKYQDVKLLEQSVAELHQMFLDFALLTEQQGELIDQIEFNVKNAADHVEDANVQVYEAIEISKGIRKKQCCILIIVIAIVIAILFGIGVLP
jgi:t-SNARE complex subunit (syntaxin)